MSYHGLKVIADPNMLDWSEDWSRVRSPSRAARRRRRGFRQRIVRMATPKKEAYRIGDTLVMHPQMVEEVKRHTKEFPCPTWP
jgi:hypothetical protein